MLNKTACAEYLTQEEYMAQEGIQAESVKSDGTFKGYSCCCPSNQACGATLILS